MTTHGGSQKTKSSAKRGVFFWLARGTATVVLAASLALVVLTVSDSQHSFKSIEVSFTDNSAHGMQIVPASCPSNPYDSDAPYGCSGSTPLCPNGVTPAPSGSLSLCTCSEGNSAACMTCHVSISPDPSAYSYSGTPVYISWSSSGNTSQTYINNIGWVAPSGATYVASQNSTDYTCTPYNASWGYGTASAASLTVNAAPSPSISISANPATVQVGQTSVITATFAPGSGDNLTNDTINIGSTSEIPYSTATTRTYSFTPTVPGTTTFLPYIMTSYYTTWNTFGHSVNVVASYPSPSCTISASPTSIARGGNTTLTWTSSNATSCTGSNFTMGGASGSTSVSPTQSTTYGGSCTGQGGTTSCTAAPVTVTCQQAWSCSGNTVVQTNTNCSTTNLTTCNAPAFCQSGSQACLYTAITFNQSGSDTGHLQILPNLVQPQATTQIVWNVSNAQSCTVTGTNGDSWSGLSGSHTTSKITGQTTYTLACTAYGTNPNVSESQSVGVTPQYHEQ